MFLDSRSRIQQSGWGQYSGSTELMVRWNGGPYGFDGCLKFKNSLWTELWMDASHHFHSMSIGPSHSWDKAICLKLHDQGHGCGERAKSYSQPSILLIHLLFISHKSDQQFLRYSYFEIWLWNIQGQGHEWGQRSRSQIMPSIQPMPLLLVSHKSNQPFLRYGQNSVSPWRNTPELKKKIC